MKKFERLARLYEESVPEIKRLALHQMETDALDFEAEDCLALLAGAAARDPVPIGSQARRTLRRLMPQAYALKYRLRQPTSTGKAGTWTEYNIDRAEIDKLKRLGLAKTQDYTQIQMDQFVRSGLHLLSGPVGRLLERLPRYSDGGRPAAIACLANLATPDAIEALTQVASLGTPQARLAAGALGDMRSDGAFQALSVLFAQAKDPELAGDIAAEMRNYPTQAALDMVTAAADAGAPPVKIGAAIALASYGKLGSASVLAKMALEEDPPVARWAMDGLARLAEPGVLPEIETCWHESHDPWTRQLCIEAAGAARDKRAQDFVKRALGAVDPYERVLAVEGLVKVHVPEQEVFALASKLVNDPHPEVAVSALLAVAPIDIGLVQHKVKGLLSDPAWEARRFAVWCLGYVQGPASLSTLKHAIYHDSDERVVLGAVKALAKYDPAEAADVLVGALRHQNKNARLTAARVLAECKDRDVARKLFPRVAQCAAAEPDPRAKAALVRAMARLGDPSQYLLVAKLLKDPVEEVVVAAIEGLDVLGSIDSIGQVDGFLADPRPAVRAQAALALWNQGELRVVKKLSEGLDSADEHVVAGSLLGVAEILASLRRLDDSSKYVLLFSELKANLKTPEFQAYAAKLKDVRLEAPLSGSRVFDLFEFRTVVDPSLPTSTPGMLPGTGTSGTHAPLNPPSAAPASPPPAPPPAPAAAPSKVGAVPLPGASGSRLKVNELMNEPPAKGRPTGRGEDSGSRLRAPGATPVPATAAPGREEVVETMPPLDEQILFSEPEPEPERPAAPPSRGKPAPVAPPPAPDEIESIPLEPLETSLSGKAFTLPPPDIDDDDDLGPATKAPEMEIEELLARVARGEGRAVLTRVFEMAREGTDPAAHLLAGQLLMEVAPADPREREATVTRAADLLEKAAKAKPGRVEAHLRLAELLRERDRNRAYKHVIASLRACADTLARQVDLAEDALQAGKADDVAALVAQLTKQLPMLGQTNAIHGEVLYRRGLYDEALEQLYLAHVAEPQSIPLMLWLVRAAARAGRDAYARHLLVNLLERKDLEKETADKARALLKKLA